MSATLSERASANIGEIPKKDRPISERYRLAGLDFAEKHKAARLLEECKSACLSQMIAKYIAENGPMPFNRAENSVKASQEWEDYVTQMVEARYQADRAKVFRDTLDMLFAEWNSAEANARSERKLTR